MRFSFSTVYMAIFTSNVLLILITFFFRSQKLRQNIGYRLLAIFSIVTLLRFFLPFELSFSQTFLLPGWISSWLSLVRHGIFHIGNLKVSAWTIILAIWIIGSLVYLIKYIHKYQKTRYTILTHMWDVTNQPRYQAILDSLCKAKRKRNRFTVVEVAGLKVPMLFGIFKPHILLPKDHNLSDTDLYYIIAHEANHHFHHDLFIKFSVQLICIIYWWNPFCKTLLKQSTMILEMRIDDVITHSDSQTIRSYLACIIQIAEQATGESLISSDLCLSILPSRSPKRKDKEEDMTDGDMVQRFEMLLSANAPKNHLINVALLITVLAIYVSSYAFIWEAHYAPPEVEETTMTAVEFGIYAVQKEDNTYDIYYGDMLMETTDSLEYYQDIPIYTEKEYYDEQP